VLSSNLITNRIAEYMASEFKLKSLGWGPHFLQQLSLEEFEQCRLGRILQQHKSQLQVATEKGLIDLPMSSDMPAVVVGDWLLLDDDGRYLRLLDRFSLFSRKAAGTKVQTQLIAANVDTAFVVTSINQDFNLSRIERYLTLVHEAGVEPVIVLTKVDLSASVESSVEAIQSLDPMLMVEAVNALAMDSVEKLVPWCGEGRTVLFLGSSGVGKSTLVNTLMGGTIQVTSGIREDDSKGRHTTTARSLHPLPSGGLLLDTPGMRELQLADVEDGLERAFADISALAQSCRFTDCSHVSEPGCAILAALEAGEIDDRRMENYRKIMREQQINSATLAEKRSRDKALGKFYRTVLSESRRRKTET
jgi:ribosome biogenesis GTPase / thiamine phosphate phosphatase